MRDMLLILRIVDECAEMHPEMLGEKFEQVVRAYFIALIRWIRNPVSEVKQFLHLGSPEVFYDMRAEPICHWQRQTLPQLDESLIFRIERVMVRHGFRAVQLEFVV